MDLEIGWAAASGLKFWAFDQYAVPGVNANIMNAWTLYQQSTIQSQMNWCWLAVSDSLFGSPGNFSAQVTQYVNWFLQSSYQKVLGNRPLLFLFGMFTWPTFGSSANFATMISALRTACTTAGLGSPYIVVMNDPSGNDATMTAIGADAISGYIGPIPGPPGVPYASLVTSTEAYWTSMANSGAPIIPNAQMGWDTRPRAGTDWVIPGTIAERAAHLSDMVKFVKNNPTTCPANTAIIYSWTECDEGGGALIPTASDYPSSSASLSAILTAARGVL